MRFRSAVVSAAILGVTFALAGCAQPKGVVFEPLGEPIRWQDPPAVADPVSWIVGEGLGA